MVTRAEHRRRTLRALSDAAVEVMEREGPDVPLERIAAAAGLSRRTIYRWVSAREDIVFIHPRLWIETFDDAVKPCGGSTLRERIRIGCAAVCEVIDQDPEPVRRAMRLVADYPQLARGAGDVNQAWIERLADEVDPRPDGPERRMRAHILGAALMGAIDAALAEWAAEHTDVSLGELVDAALGHLAPVLRSPS